MGPDLLYCRWISMLSLSKGRGGSKTNEEQSSQKQEREKDQQRIFAPKKDHFRYSQILGKFMDSNMKSFLSEIKKEYKSGGKAEMMGFYEGRFCLSRAKRLFNASILEACCFAYFDRA